MIEVRVTYTPEDYLRVFRFTATKQTRIFTIMLVLGAALLAFLLYRANPAGFHWWAIPAIGALTCLFLGLIRWLQRFNIGRQVKSIPGSSEPYVYTFTEEGITIAGRLSSANIKWEALVKARESQTDLLFYTAKRFAQFLPKRAFDSEALTELRSMLRRNLGERAQLQ